MSREDQNHYNPEETRMAHRNLGEAHWDKTELAAERAKKSPLYEKPDEESRNGYFKGRQIIGRNTQINKGVYIGGSTREAIVVDDSKDVQLTETYRELEAAMEKVEAYGGKYRQNILNKVFDISKIKIPYNSDKVNEIFKKYELKDDTKISLGIYISEDAGVCRHQALLVAYLLERLRSEGKIRGQISIDRNYVKGMGGHAWVRYTNSKGVAYVIDPAQNFIGSLEKAEKNGKWHYKRPDEK